LEIHKKEEVEERHEKKANTKATNWKKKKNNLIDLLQI